MIENIDYTKSNFSEKSLNTGSGTGSETGSGNGSGIGSETGSELGSETGSKDSFFDFVNTAVEIPPSRTTEPEPEPEVETEPEPEKGKTDSNNKGSDSKKINKEVAQKWAHRLTQISQNTLPKLAGFLSGNSKEEYLADKAELEMLEEAWTDVISEMEMELSSIHFLLLAYLAAFTAAIFTITYKAGEWIFKFVTGLFKRSKTSTTKNVKVDPNTVKTEPVNNEENNDITPEEEKHQYNTEENNTSPTDTQKMVQCGYSGCKLNFPDSNKHFFSPKYDKHFCNRQHFSAYQREIGDFVNKKKLTHDE